MMVWHDEAQMRRHGDSRIDDIQEVESQDHRQTLLRPHANLI